jgi:elongation factor P hydroxylase
MVMRIKISESIRAVTVYTDDNTDLASRIADICLWLKEGHNLLDHVDYNYWVEPGKIIFKFYDENNDYVGMAPTGFESLFALKWT